MLTDKDKEAIAHIASVSKHPHAAMMAEWLITSCEVKLDGKVNNNPYWHKDYKYELVYPKTKPAYRVYRYKGERGTNTQDRFENGSLSHIGDITQVVFMGDWAEYQKWPTPLVERIAAIEPEAAQWIVDNWDDLVAGKYTRRDCNATTDILLTMFHWTRSPQGHDYWRHISGQLGE